MNALQSQLVGASGGNSGWVWVWLANQVGQAGATAIQSLIMVVLYGLSIWVVVKQIFRIVECWGDKNHKDPNVKREANENIKAGFIIIAVVGLIAGVGFTMVFFFLNKFMGV